MLSKKEIKWSAPEFEYIQKGIGWYWLTIIVAIVLSAFALWQENVLFAVFVVIAAVLVLTWGKSYPKTIEFTINENGLAIGEQKNYSYGELKGFVVRQGYVDSELVEIVFQKKSRLSPYIKILASDQDAEVIKEFLIQYLPEVKYEESLIEHIAKILRF